MSGLKLRSDITRYWGKGVWPGSGKTSRGGLPGGGGMPGGGMDFHGLGFDRTYRFRRDPPGMGRTRAERGLMGLGDDPETILNTPDPVGLYIKALQALFAQAEGTQGGYTADWDRLTHNNMLVWAASIFGVEDVSRFPAWGQDPGFTAYFVVEILFGGFEMDRAFDALTVFFSTLGLPTTSRAEALGVLSQPENAKRMRVVLDRVVRYIIGAEGGQVYGSKPVQYEGIAAGVAAVVGSVAAILMVG